MRNCTAHNTANTDTPFVEKNNSGCSIVFASRKIDLLIGGKSNGGVCRDFIRNSVLEIYYER